MPPDCLPRRLPLHGGEHFPHRQAPRSWRRFHQLYALLVLAPFMLTLLACNNEVPTLHILIGDPSPRGNNTPLAAQSLSTAGRVLSLAVAGQDPQRRRVYAGTVRAGVWRSDDSGGSWRQLTWPQTGDHVATCAGGAAICTLPPLTIVDIAVASDNPDLVFAAASLDGRSSAIRDGIYRSQDGGATWSRVYQFMCGGQVQPVTQVTFAQDSARELWAAGGCGIAHSTPDSSGRVGMTWTLTTMPDGAQVYHVAAAAASNPTARWVYACGGKNLYYSTNGGASYLKDTDALATLPDRACGGLGEGWYEAEGFSSSQMAIAPNEPNVLYVAVSQDSNGPSYGLVDANGHDVPPGTPCNVALDPSVCGGSLYVGRRHLDGSPGASWTRVPSPPYYGLDSGAIGVRTQPMRDGYLVLFMDGDGVSVAVGMPTANGWHRLDYADPSLLAGLTTWPNLPIHVDPHAIAFTPDFALTLSSPPTASDPRYQHDRVLGACSAGSDLLVANDGGVYHSVDCGRTWQPSLNLETLTVNRLAGLPQPGGAAQTYHLPALYFGTADNLDWGSLDGGLHWTNEQRDAPNLHNCGDCVGFWADPLLRDRLVHLSGYQEDGLVAFIGPSGRAPDPQSFGAHSCPDPIHTCDIALGIPPTISTASDLTYNYYYSAIDWEAGWRPVVASLATAAGAPTPPPPIDLVIVAPVAAPTAPAVGATLTPQRVWRKQTLISGSDGWIQDGTNQSSILPDDATIVQAAGGHVDPVYYVGNRVPDDRGDLLLNGGSPVFSDIRMGDRLYRSHRGADHQVDGWDCIVPGPAHPGIHDHACAAAVIGSGPQHARRFVSDPYDANIIYVADETSIYLSTNGGASWRQVASLTNWLTDGGTIHATCRQFCAPGGATVAMLASMEFVPDEPQMRFAEGEAGVFFTNDGASSGSVVEHWHRLLDPDALACLPHNAYFDKTNALGRILYVACVGRSLLSFTGIPRPGVALKYDMQLRLQTPYPTNPGLSGSLPTPPSAANVAPSPDPDPGSTPLASTTPSPGPKLAFTVTPVSYKQVCQGTGGLPAYQITLDNTRSTIAASWATTIMDRDPAKNLWATASPTNGIIPAGQTATLTVSPLKTLCGDLQNTSSPVEYHVLISYAGKVITITDTVAPPIPG